MTWYVGGTQAPAVGDLVFRADGSSGPWTVRKIDDEGRLYLGIPGFDGYFDNPVDASEVARVG